jgi:hypothetical protein
MRLCQSLTLAAGTGMWLAISPPLVAQDAGSGHEMTQSDFVMAAVSTTAIGGDWLTTLRNVRRSQQPGWNGHEINPILGPHPSIGRVNTVFVAATLTNVAVGVALPHRLRKVFWAVVTGVESLAVLINLSQY